MSQSSSLQIGQRVVVIGGLLRGKTGTVASSGGREGYAVELDNGQIVGVPAHLLSRDSESES